MYTPKHFQNHDATAIKNFVTKNGFATLVSQVEGKLWATHLPLLLNEEGTKLSGHVSRANKQWKNFTEGEVLSIFHGPHTYISSSWYNHENVPTWNYIAVHVYGTVHLIEGEALFQSLKYLVDKYEKESERPVSIEKMTPHLLQQDMRGIVGFEIEITRIEATNKLSQNRDKVNHAAIIEHLEKKEDYNAQAIASAMKENGYKEK